LKQATKSRDRRREGGVALLAVMCTVTVLILVALTFSNSVQIETRTVLFRKEAAQAHAMAVGGVEAAILEIAYPPGMDQRTEPRLWGEGRRGMTVPYQGGQAVVEIVDESGKIGLNAAGQEQLLRLFEARDLDPDAASHLASAILHWRGPAVSSSEQGRDEASLEDYYRGAGYGAAHAPFTSLEQVLSVRGMAREIFYGTAEFDQGRISRRYGVGRDLTVYSPSPAVNINYASQAVLLSVPGMTPALVEQIIRERDIEPFKSADDLAQRLASPLPPRTLPFLDTASSRFYSILATGELTNSRVQRSVKAVVQIAPDGQARHRLIGWYDDEVPE